LERVSVHRGERRDHREKIDNDSDFGKGKKMRKNYVTILFLAMAAVVLLSASRPCRAVEKDDKLVWSEDKPERWHGWFELTDEAIERTMNRLRETNPEKAKELAKLREKDPEKFKAKIRKIREKFGKRPMKHMERRAERMGWWKEGKPDEAIGHYHKALELGRKRAPRMREKHAEYLEWLKKNYPEKAEKLAELRKTRPELYMKKLGLSRKKYGRIAEAAEENPELAEALKEDLELKKKRDKLFRKIRTAADDDEKKKYVGKLEEVISKRFDLIVKRKQIKYERMRKKLEKLEAQVKRSEAKVKKWQDVEFKSESVKTRLEELVSETEKFKWE